MHIILLLSEVSTNLTYLFSVVFCGDDCWTVSNLSYICLIFLMFYHKIMVLIKSWIRYINVILLEKQLFLKVQENPMPITKLRNLHLHCQIQGQNEGQGNCEYQGPALTQQ